MLNAEVNEKLYYEEKRMDPPILIDNKKVFMVLNVVPADTPPDLIYIYNKAQ